MANAKQTREPADNPDAAVFEDEPRTGGAGQQLRAQASEVGHNLRDMAGTVREAAREQAGRVRNSAVDYYEEGRERLQRWEHGIEDYVQAQPIKSLLIAAGVGVLLGIVLRGKSR